MMQLTGQENGSVNTNIDLRRLNMKFDLLLEMKKSKKQPKEGDVFVLNPRKEVFCFGKVIMTNIVSRDSFVNGMNLIFIYDYFSPDENIPDNIESYNILLVEVVNNQLWLKGFAKNIAYSEVTENEINVDYAFWDMLKNEYVDLKGDSVDYIPKIKGTYGLGSYGIVGKEIQKVIKERGI